MKIRLNSLLVVELVVEVSVKIKLLAACRGRNCYAERAIWKVHFLVFFLSASSRLPVWSQQFHVLHFSNLSGTTKIDLILVAPTRTGPLIYFRSPLFSQNPFIFSCSPYFNWFIQRRAVPLCSGKWNHPFVQMLYEWHEWFVGPTSVCAPNIAFLARDVIYTSRAYATMSVSVCLSVCLWRKCMLI